MKNPLIRVDEESVFITVTNTMPYQTVTASVASLDVLNTHRVRVIEGVPLTTTVTGSMEVGIELANIIRGEPKNSPVTYRDGNPLNVSLDNLICEQDSRQEIIYDGDRAFLLTRGYTIILDTDDVPRIEPYTWLPVYHRNRLQIVAKIDGQRKLFLPRLILNLKKGNNLPVIHLNGDRLDMRKSNLAVDDDFYARRNRTNRSTPVEYPSQC